MHTDQPLITGNFHILKPRKALNKVYLKAKPNRSQIEQFKLNLIELLVRTNETESEEFHKNLGTYFLKKTDDDPQYRLKGREKENPTADTSSLEAEIELTDEEVQIIKNSIN